MSFAVTNAATQREALRRLAEMTQRAIIHPAVVKAARTITADCPARDDQCELEAIYAAVKSGDARVAALKNGVRYVADPLVTDWFAGPHRLLEMCADGACAGDCLPADTKVLGSGYRLVDIGDVHPGDVIMGDGGWTRVTNFWDKGEQPLLAFELGNGCVLRCTADHRVYRVPRSTAKGAPQGPRDQAEEVRAGDLQVGDDLLTDNYHPHARIKAISEAEPAPTVDIEVEGHRFYLPETDLIVHNCDEQSALVVALAGAVGFPVGLRVWGPPGQASQLGRMSRLRRAGAVSGRGAFGAAGPAGPGGFPDPEYVHVYAVAGIPKRADGAVHKWVGMDTTVGSAFVGWEPTRGYFLTAVVQGG